MNNLEQKDINNINNIINKKTKLVEDLKKESEEISKYINENKEKYEEMKQVISNQETIVNNYNKTKEEYEIKDNEIKSQYEKINQSYIQEKKRIEDELKSEFSVMKKSTMEKNDKELKSLEARFNQKKKNYRTRIMSMKEEIKKKENELSEKNNNMEKLKQNIINELKSGNKSVGIQVDPKDLTFLEDMGIQTNSVELPIIKSRQRGISMDEEAEDLELNKNVVRKDEENIVIQPNNEVFIRKPHLQNIVSFSIPTINNIYIYGKLFYSFDTFFLGDSGEVLKVGFQKDFRKLTTKNKKIKYTTGCFSISKNNKVIKNIQDSKTPIQSNRKNKVYKIIIRKNIIILNGVSVRIQNDINDIKRIKSNGSFRIEYD